MCNSRGVDKLNQGGRGVRSLDLVGREVGRLDEGGRGVEGWMRAAEK